MNPAKPLPNQALTREQVAQRWAALPKGFRNGVVGLSMHAVARHLDEAGQAPMGDVLQALYPGMPLNQARRVLSSQVCNRPYVDVTGLAPLQVKASRVLRGQFAQASVWFEGPPMAEVAHALPDNPRYAPENFVSAMGQQATGQELLAQSQALRKALQDGAATEATKADTNRGRTSMRHGASVKDFTDAHA